MAPKEFGLVRTTELAPNWFVIEPQGSEPPDLELPYEVDGGFLIWLSIKDLSDVLAHEHYDQIIDYYNLSRFDDWLQKHHHDAWKELH